MHNNNIDTPIIYDLEPGKKLGSAIYVHKNQPLSVHKTIEQLAYYFKCEFHYDFVQYYANEDRGKNKCDAYIWVHEHWDEIVVVGAGCFRFKGDVDQAQKWAFDWVWFHPYWRRRGLLTQAWPHFKKKYGNFLCPPPISPAMKSFIEKMEESK